MRTTAIIGAMLGTALCCAVAARAGDPPERVPQRPTTEGRRLADESRSATRVAPGPAVRMVASAPVVPVGATLTIEVRVNDVSGLAHAPFHVRFDPRVLRFDGAEEGSLLDADGRATVFVARTDSTGEAVVVGLSRLGRVGGVDGNGVLCRLSFTALVPGDAALEFSRGRLKDEHGDDLPAAFVPTRATVRP